MSLVSWNDGHAWKFKGRRGDTITLKCAVCAEYKEVPFEEAKDIYAAWREENKEELGEPEPINKEGDKL